MSDYTKLYDYAAKDALLTGNPLKKVKGVEIGADFDAVSVAIATKYDVSDLGVTVQAYDAQLADIAGLTPTDNGVVIGNGANFVVESGATLKTSLGLTIGVDVQAYDADLTTWAGVTPGSGVATFLATPSSANLASAITDETGSGLLVFATTPTLTSVKETRTAPTIGGGTLTLDLSGSSIFDVSLNAAITTLTISNPAASGTAHGFVLTFTADGTARAVTWPAAVKWPSATAPTLTSANGKKDTFTMFSTDGGTTWNAFICGQNL